VRVLSFLPRRSRPQPEVRTDPVEPGHVLWLLGSLSQLYRIPFDPRLILQRFTPPYSLVTVCEAAEAIGLQLGKWTQVGPGPESLPLPCVALLRPSSRPVSAEPATGPAHAGQASPPKPSARPALILKADKQRILYFRAGGQSGETASLEEFGALFEPVVLPVSREASQSASPAEADQLQAEEEKKFGFGWFVPELLKHKRVWRDVLIASLAIQLVGLATPLFTQAIIDKVIVHQTHSTLVVLAFALGAFMLFSSVMTWVRQYLVIHTGNRIDAVLGTHVFSHLLRLPPRYFEQRPTGVIVSRLHGVETIRDFITGAAVSLVLDLPFLVIFLVVMFYYSWELSLVALTGLALISVASAIATPIFRRRLNKQFLLGARNQAFVTEYVSGMATVKTMQLEPLLERRYGDYLGGFLAAGFKARQLSNTVNVIASAVEQAMTLGILITGALLVMRNDGFTIGMLVAFQMFASRMSQPMLRLVGLWQEFQQASVAVRRLGDMMNVPTEPYTVVPARSARHAGRIDVVDLSFRYSERHTYIFRNFNLQLRPGQITVLMGPSGSGKSTLSKLLLGFYQPEDGRVLVDGRDLRSLSANELRQCFGVVPQETVLFAGSVYENLVMANPHATFDDVIDACRKAEIHDVIESLPQGYQTALGEHGVGLSGGQRQRIAIARALLKRPAVLIFDEATSNLDSETSEHFARTINQLKGSTTILFITHALPRGLAVDALARLGGEQARPAPHLVERDAIRRGAPAVGRYGASSDPPSSSVH
jgi:subfamily B ATP-binding cassette protein HlyB/CyaB